MATSDQLRQAPGCGACAGSGELSRAIRDRAVAGFESLTGLKDQADALIDEVTDAAWQDVAERGSDLEGQFVVERIERPVLSVPWCDYSERTYSPAGPCGEYSPGLPSAGFVSARISTQHTAPREPDEIRRIVMPCDIDGLRVLAARWQGIGRDLDSVASALEASVARWPDTETNPVAAIVFRADRLAAAGREIAGQFIAMAGAVQVFAQGAGEAKAGLLRLADETEKAAPHLAFAPELQLVALSAETKRCNELFGRHFVMSLVSSSRQLPRFTDPSVLPVEVSADG